jgi:hypothetical protein
MNDKSYKAYKEVKGARIERRYVCGGDIDHRDACRRYHKADRRAAKGYCRAFLR